MISKNACSDLNISFFDSIESLRFFSKAISSFFNSAEAPFKDFKGQMDFFGFEKFDFVREKSFKRGKRALCFFLESDKEKFEFCKIFRKISIPHLKEDFSKQALTLSKPGQDWILKKECNDFLKLAIKFAKTDEFFSFHYLSIGVSFKRKLPTNTSFKTVAIKAWGLLEKPEERVDLNLFLEKMEDGSFSSEIFMQFDEHLSSFPWGKGPGGF